MLPFARKLEHLGYPDLKAENVGTLQVNLGWRCNQACKHCHLVAGPHRPEQMERHTIDEVIRVVERWSIPTVDLTGGAPELNPHYEYLVARLTELGTHILTRCNLTILLEPGKEHLAEFYRDHRVELVCSLPYYQEDLVDRLRGPGVFQKSLEACAVLIGWATGNRARTSGLISCTTPRAPTCRRSGGPGGTLPPGTGWALRHSLPPARDPAQHAHRALQGVFGALQEL